MTYGPTAGRLPGQRFLGRAHRVSGNGRSRFGTESPEFVAGPFDLIVEEVDELADVGKTRLACEVLDIATRSRQSFCAERPTV